MYQPLRESKYISKIVPSFVNVNAGVALADGLLPARASALCAQVGRVARGAACRRSAACSGGAGEGAPRPTGDCGARVTVQVAARTHKQGRRCMLLILLLF